LEAHTNVLREFFKEMGQAIWQIWHDSLEIGQVIWQHIKWGDLAAHEDWTRNVVAGICLRNVMNK